MLLWVCRRLPFASRSLDGWKQGRRSLNSVSCAQLNWFRFNCDGWRCCREGKGHGLALNGTLLDFETGLEAKNGAETWADLREVCPSPHLPPALPREHMQPSTTAETLKINGKDLCKNLVSSCSRRRKKKTGKNNKIDSCQKQCVQQLECLSIARECDSRASFERFCQ